MVLLVLVSMLPAAVPVQAQLGQVTGVVRDAGSAAPAPSGIRDVLALLWLWQPLATAVPDWLF